MNFATRALIFMTRNRGKAFSFLAIVLVLGIVVSGAISVRQAIQNTDNHLRQGLPPVASVGIDYETLQKLEDATGEWQEIDSLALEIYSQLGALPYVSNYDISVGGNLLSRDLERVSSSEDMSVTDFGTGDWMPIGLKGVHSSNLVDVEEGIIEITSGRIFTEQEATALNYAALISEEFASHNNLHIGSTFTLNNIVWDTRGMTFMDSSFYIEDNIYTQHSHDFEVIGIFAALAQFNTGDEWTDASMLDEHLNRIYVPNPVAMAAHIYHIEYQARLEPDNEWLQGNPKDSLWISNVYILNNSSDIENFRQAAENILPEFWIIADMSDSFGGIASAMENIGRIAVIVLWVAIGASVIILSLLITLFMRERKREIGILLAIGEKKITVMAQAMTEVLAVTLVAVVLSLFAGNLFAGGISEVMLRNDMATALSGDNEGIAIFTHMDMMGFGGEAASTEEILANYNVSLDISMAGMFFALAIGTVMTATIMPMLYIMKLNPRKILM